MPAKRAKRAKDTRAQKNTSFRRRLSDPLSRSYCVQRLARHQKWVGPVEHVTESLPILPEPEKFPSEVSSTSWFPAPTAWLTIQRCPRVQSLGRRGHQCDIEPPNQEPAPTFNSSGVQGPKTPCRASSVSIWPPNISPTMQPVRTVTGRF